MQERLAAEGIAAAMHAEAVLQNWEDGAPKLYLIWRALQLRREYPRLFAEGDYTPLAAAGERAENVVAYARRQGDVGCDRGGRAALRAARRRAWRPAAGASRVGRHDGADGHPRSRAARPLNVLTGRSVEVLDGRLLMADVFADFPAALLLCEGTPVNPDAASPILSTST